MKLRIEIDLENDSMLDSNYQEIGIIFGTHWINIIEECKTRRTNPCPNDYYCNIKDENGNSIGQWSVKNK